VLRVTQTDVEQTDLEHREDAPKAQAVEVPKEPSQTSQDSDPMPHNGVVPDKGGMADKGAMPHNGKAESEDDECTEEADEEKVDACASTASSPGSGAVLDVGSTAEAAKTASTASNKQCAKHELCAQSMSPDAPNVKRNTPEPAEVAQPAQTSKPLASQPSIHEKEQETQEFAPAAASPPKAHEEEASVVEAIEPVVEATQPVVEAIQPVVEAMQPVVEAIEPVVEALQPVVEATEPVVEATEPTASETAEQEPEKTQQESDETTKDHMEETRALGDKSEQVPEEEHAPTVEATHETPAPDTVALQAMQAAAEYERAAVASAVKTEEEAKEEAAAAADAAVAAAAQAAAAQAAANHAATAANEQGVSCLFCCLSVSLCACVLVCVCVCEEGGLHTSRWTVAFIPIRVISNIYCNGRSNSLFHSLYLSLSRSLALSRSLSRSLSLSLLSLSLSLFRECSPNSPTRLNSLQLAQLEPVWAS